MCGVLDASRAKGSAGRSQLLQCVKKIVGEARQIVRRECQQLFHVDAVDDERWIRAVRRLLAIDADDGAVVVHGGFWGDTADDAERFHRLIRNGLVSRSSPMVVRGPWPGTTIVSSGSART